MDQIGAIWRRFPDSEIGKVLINLAKAGDVGPLANVIGQIDEAFSKSLRLMARLNTD